VKSSPFGQFLLSQIQEEAGFQKLIAETDFDPRRDLREVLVGSDNASQGNNVVVVKGSFDETKITAAANVHGGSVTTYQGVKLIGPPGNVTDPGKSGVIAFIGPGLLLVGQSTSVKAAIDRQRTGSRLSPELAARVQATAGDYDAWLVTATSPANLASRVPERTASGAMQGNVIQAIEYVSGGVRFGSNVELAGEAVTKTAQDATALVDVVRFLGSMAASNAPTQSPIAKLYESLQLTALGNTVRFSVTAPEQDIETFFKTKRGNTRTKKVVYIR
jgi:hypothetical protein